CNNQTCLIGLLQMDIPRGNSIDVTSCQVCFATVGITYIRPGEVGLAEVGTTKVGLAEVGTTKVSSNEVSLGEVGLDEVGSAEVGSAEIWSKIRMLLSPLVPNLYALFKNIKMFLDCHNAYIPSRGVFIKFSF